MLEKCSLTNSPLVQYISTKDYFLSQEPFTLLANEDQSLLVTSPIPEDLGKFYESEEYISHNNPKKGIIQILYSIGQSYSLGVKKKLLVNHSGRSRSILDYGCGSGAFLSYMKKFDWSIAGVEPNELAREIAAKNTGIAIHSLKEFELSTEKYSGITLWHVFEHIPNFSEILDALVAKLDKDGIIVLALPNFKSWDARHYKNYWAAYDVPRHVYHWSKSGIDHLVRMHGLKVVDRKAMWLDAFYVSIISERYKKSQFPILMGFINGFISNLSAVFTRESSSIIYILKKA